MSLFFDTTANPHTDSEAHRADCAQRHLVGWHCLGVSKFNLSLDCILHGAVGFCAITSVLSLHSDWVSHSFCQNSSLGDPDAYCHSLWGTFWFGLIIRTNDESVIEHRQQFRNYEQSINLWGLVSQSKECNSTPNLIENSLRKGQLMRKEQFCVSEEMKWWNLRVYQRFKNCIWLSPVTGVKLLSQTDMCKYLILCGAVLANWPDFAHFLLSFSHLLSIRWCQWKNKVVKTIGTDAMKKVVFCKLIIHTNNVIAVVLLLTKFIGLHLIPKGAYMTSFIKVPWKK